MLLTSPTSKEGVLRKFFNKLKVEIIHISMILVMFFSYLQKNNIEKNIKIEIKEN